MLNFLSINFFEEFFRHKEKTKTVREHLCLGGMAVKAE